MHYTVGKDHVLSGHLVLFRVYILIPTLKVFTKMLVPQVSANYNYACSSLVIHNFQGFVQKEWSN